MSRVKSRDTEPELIVRKMLHAMGFRFRLQRKDLPGTPDIILPKYRTVIFVHGCFWHRHEGCRYTTTPKTNVAFWNKKFSTNVDRDRSNQNELKEMGWKVLVVWQCEIKDSDALQGRLLQELG